MSPNRGGSKHRPRRRFGQHFLTDLGVVDRLVRSIRPDANRPLVEIGPGLGVLTCKLIDRVPELDVVEIDRDLARELPARLGHPAGLRVHETDALKLDFDSLRSDSRKLRIVGNLPYNISSPLLFHLLDQREAIEDMVFMLQSEVVDRMVAAPGSRDYGRLSVMLGLWCSAQKLFEVPREAFSPPPKVRSAVVQLSIRSQAAMPVADLACFDRIVRQAFSQRRKTLRNALRGMVAPEHWQAADIDASRRAETLHIVDFVRLSNEVSG